MTNPGTKKKKILSFLFSRTCFREIDWFVFPTIFISAIFIKNQDFRVWQIICKCVKIDYNLHSMNYLKKYVTRKLIKQKWLSHTNVSYQTIIWKRDFKALKQVIKDSYLCKKYHLTISFIKYSFEKSFLKINYIYLKIQRKDMANEDFGVEVTGLKWMWCR